MNACLRFPLAALATLCLALPALAQYPLNVGGPQNDVANATHYDDLGNTYLVGAFRTTADFDPSPAILPLTSVGNTDAFVASYDAGGAVRWAFALSSPGREAALDVQHQNGVLYVTGHYEGSVDFDPGSATVFAPVGGGLDAFVAAYDVTGTSPVLLWVAPIFGPGEQIGQDLDIHPLPPFNVWVTGSLKAGADFGGPILVSAGDRDIFVAGYDALTGTTYDAFRLGAGGLDEGLGLSLVRPNLPCITGRFRNTVDFDPSGGVFNLTAAGEDAFVACYVDIPAGNPTIFGSFAPFRIGGPSIDRGYDLTTPPNRVVVTGTFVGTADFGGPLFTSNGAADAFVASYDLSAAPQWVVPFGGPQVDAGLGIDDDDCGNVYASGAFRAGPVDFDPFAPPPSYTLPTFAGFDAWTASYDASGGFRFANRVAQNQQDVGWGVAVKPASGSHLAAGQLGATPTFSSGTTVSAISPVTSNGALDGWLAAYNTNGALQTNGSGHPFPLRVSCPAPPPGLQVWTDFDAFSAGLYLDLTTPTTPPNDGFPVGSVVTGPGVVDRAAHFPAPNDHIRINPDPSLALGADDLSVDAWVQHDLGFVSDYLTIVSNLDPIARDGYEVQVRRATNTDWVIHVFIGDGSTAFSLISPIFPFPPSTWRFVAVTVDHAAVTTATFYLDGVAIGTATSPALGPISHPGPMFEHRSVQFSGNDQPGWLDEVEVFHALLSSDEVGRIYRYAKCKPCFTAPFQPTARTAASTVLGVDFAPDAPVSAAMPTAFVLEAGRPNPFRGRTEIAFSLDAAGPVRLLVYDMLGRRVATLVDEAREAGAHTAVFDAGALPSGVYLVRLEAAGQAATQRVTLVR